MENKFTPGPWEWKGLPHLRYRGKYCFLVDSEGYELLSGSPVPSPHICIDNEADAHLIAAAPDMYEALFDALGYINGSIPDWQKGSVIRRITDAMCKAEGRRD